MITESELLVRPERTGDASEYERITDLLSEDGIQVVPVDRRIARLAAGLRGRLGLRLADAIIAATAIQTGCDAIVGNDRDFDRLKEVPFVRLDDLVGAAETGGRRRRAAGPA